ncbi:M4 family metallopeptidase [Mesobacillus jeotgali]|uniref:M4 family metallopeptidase n=1 Tax=Mesobacillus jeotgali TaxID=129985 RepID=UPI0009A66B9E|nr:M4 family metallopeptidase [Mesobacillus jeotgali]
MEKKKLVIPMLLSTALMVSPLVGSPANAVQPDQVSSTLSLKVVSPIQQNPSVFMKAERAAKTGAVEFLEENKDQLKLNNPGKSLKVKSEETDKLGMKHVRLQQTINGVPVEGAELVVHYNKDGTVKSVNGQYNNDIAGKDLSVQTNISAEQALEIAKGSVSAPDELETKPKTELVVYPFNDSEYLAYKVNVNFLGEHPGNWFVYIDAKTGNVVDQYNGLMHAGEYTASKGSGLGVKGDHRVLNISHQNEARSQEGSTFYLYDNTLENAEGIFTYDFKNQWRSSTTRLPGDLFASKDAAWTSDYERAGVDAHYNSEKVYHYFLNEHDRNSIDGKGMAIISSVHYGDKYNNAFWNGSQMTYGDGDGDFMISLSAGLDVAAHEMTHGVTNTSANLKYRFQSGALNEAFSDIFGALIDEDDWELGEDIMGKTAVDSGRDALRSLSNPNRFPVGSAYFAYGNGEGKYPKHMDEYYNLPLNLDNGGVHINSSIINHAAYLTGEQIGKQKLGQIYYRALTVYLTPDSNFSDARKALLQSADDLFGAGSEEYKATQAGLDGVGITE